MMMSAEGPSRDANCTPWGAAQRREPQVSGDHAAKPLAFVGLRGTLAQDALLARYTSWRVRRPRRTFCTRPRIATTSRISCAAFRLTCR